MKKVLLILGFTTVFSIPVLHAATFMFDIEFTQPVLEIENSDQSLSVAGAESIYLQQNWPAIPYRLVVKEYPLGSKIDTIRVTTRPIQEITLDHPLPFTLGPQFMSKPPKPQVFDPFDSSKPYPRERVLWSMHGGLDPKTLQHRSILVLRIFPVQYIEQSRLIFTSKVTIEIDMNIPEQPHLLSNRWENSTKSQRDVEPFVVVTTDAFIPVFTQYLDHKTSFGLEPAVYSIETILENTPGTDDAEKLKYFIKDRVEQSATSFILLAGDADILPVRRAPQTGDPHGVGKIPMEGYFSDLYDSNGNFPSWNFNGDDVFGDYTTDLQAMDLLPDVFVSRIPASTVEELSIALNHVIQYESNTTPDDAWMNRVLFAAVDIFTESDSGDTTGIPEGERFAEFLSDGTFYSKDIIRLYETDVYPHDDTVSPDTVVSWASLGCGFMAFHSHGSPDCFWLKDVCFDNTHAANLMNGEMLPVMFGLACSTAAFDNELPGWQYSSGGESMAEHFLLNPYGGGISYVGATRVACASSFQHAQYRNGTGALEYPYFSAYNHDLKTPAQMLAYAQRSFIENVGIGDWYDFLTITEYAQFGDPTVAIGGISPVPIVVKNSMRCMELTGDGDTCMEAGETHALHVTLLNTGITADNVTAVLSTSDPWITIPVQTTNYGTLGRYCQTSPDYPLEISISELSPTGRTVEFEFTIQIDGQHHRTETIRFFIGEGPHLDFVDWDSYYDSTPNENVDPGDTICPAIFINNSGCHTADNVVLSASCDSQYIEKFQINNGGACGNILPGYGNISDWLTMVLEVAPNCPHGTDLDISVEMTSDSGGPWNMEFTIPVLDHTGPELTEYSVSPQSACEGEEIQILSKAYDVSGIRSVMAMIQTHPDGNTFQLQLFDDGTHGDQDADDGLYANQYLPVYSSTNYLVHLTAFDERDNASHYPEIGAFTTIPLEIRDVMLLDSTLNPNSVGIITSALDMVGAEYFVWDQRFRGPIGGESNHNFHDSTLIWCFGASNYPSESECGIIESYLEGGGGLLLCGWDLARFVHRNLDPEWLDRNFGIQFRGNTIDSLWVDGVTGDPVGDGLEIRLKKNYDDKPLTPDKVVVIDPAVTAMTFRDAPDDPGVVCKRDTGTRTLFLPFSLEGFRFEDHLAEFLDQALPWLADHPASPQFSLSLNQDFFIPGDLFLLEAHIGNPYPAMMDVSIYVVLTIENYFWFYPSWCQYPPDIDFDRVSIEPFASLSKPILDFVWPESGASGSDIQFFGAILDPETMDLLADCDIITFGFGS